MKSQQGVIGVKVLIGLLLVGILFGCFWLWQNQYLHPLNLLSRDTLKTGSFKVDFAYPASAIPPVKLCFENIKNLNEQYCFGFLDEASFNKQIFLPVGNYYAYLLVYWRGDAPGDVVNLNQCQYAQTDEEIELFCKRCREQKEARKQIRPVCDLLMSSKDTNINYGGDRIVFTIKENEVLEMGIIDVAPWIWHC